MKKMMRNQAGFTFMELLSVLVVLSVLASIAVINLNHGQKTVNDHIAKVQVASIELAAQTCRNIYGSSVQFREIRSSDTDRSVKCENNAVVQVLPEGLNVIIESDSLSGAPREIRVTVTHEDGGATFCRNNSRELVSVPKGSACP